MSLKEEDLKRQWNKAISHPEVTNYWINSDLFNPELQDSIWYGSDEIVLEIKYMNRFTFIIRGVGDIDMEWFEKDEEVADDKCSSFDEYEIRTWLGDHKIFSDTDMAKAIDVEKLVFDNNNWFQAELYDCKEDEYISDNWDSTWDTEPVNVDSEGVMEYIREYLRELLDEEEGHHIMAEFD